MIMICTRNMNSLAWGSSQGWKIAMDGTAPIASPQSRYARAGTEPPIAEVMADPIVHLVMARDRISEREVREAIRQAVRALHNHE
jgi:hypothetical protein